ncbi:MAG TPA: hypothetical protein ENH95_02925 [Nitrosopumilus sp.]|nr:hypothetical protein [Nitrosopumilus sp.]
MSKTRPTIIEFLETMPDYMILAIGKKRLTKEDIISHLKRKTKIGRLVKKIYGDYYKSGFPQVSKD